jgi:hypothetical protein
MACWKKQKRSKEDVEAVFLEHQIDLNRIRSASEAWITELEKNLKELKHERNLVKDMLGGLIMELERKEEDGTVICAHYIIQQLELALSQCTMSRNAH